VLLNWNGADLSDYVLATYGAHAATVIASGFFVLRHAGALQRPGRLDNVRALFMQGGTAQIANLFQLANYRSAFYFIEAFRGTAAVGVYSVAMQLAEGSWLVPKSIGGVLYSKVSNLEERRRQVLLTIMLFKLAVLAGLACSVALVLLPDGVFSVLFGPEVNGLRPILLAIAPGLIAMSGSQVLSHFFSGTGSVKHNLVGSGLGLLVTFTLGWWLIRTDGLVGAALTASVAYSISLLYQLVVFTRRDQIALFELLPQQGDLRKAQLIWKAYRNKPGSSGSYL
jgi:O-antigen/teichoic acid export membrane protein